MLVDKCHTICVACGKELSNIDLARPHLARMLGKVGSLQDSFCQGENTFSSQNQYGLTDSGW